MTVSLLHLPQQLMQSVGGGSGNLLASLLACVRMDGIQCSLEA